MSTHTYRSAFTTYALDHLELLAREACALSVVVEHAAKLLDSDECIAADALRATDSMICTSISDLMADLKKMLTDPQWHNTTVSPVEERARFAGVGVES